MMKYPRTSEQFKTLENKGYTVVYKFSDTSIDDENWSFWGKKTDESKEIYVYRKIVPIDQVQQ